MAHVDSYEQGLRRDASNNQVALVIGAGVSLSLTQGARTASWKGLLDDGLELIEEIFPNRASTAAHLRLGLQADSSSETYLLAAQYIDSTLRKSSEGEFSRWIHRAVGQLSLEDRTLALALPRVRYIITTNYDGLLGSALDREALVWTDDDAFNEFSRSDGEYIFHIHGHYREKSSIILSPQDYGRLDGEGRVQESLRNLARSNSLLFVGFGAGLDDPNFNSLTTWLEREQSDSRFRHYILLTRAEREDFDHELRLKQRLTPVVYGETHDDLPTFLQTLNSVIDREPEVKSPLVSEVEESGSYSGLFGSALPNPIIEEIQRTLGEYDKLDAFQKTGLEVCFRVANFRQPGLICAVTGTGKTTLARIAINVALAQRKSGIALLPTKALVAQEAKEWSTWQSAWRKVQERGLRVYPASRDFPEHDRPVSRGRYEVAVAIYEKLGVYLVSGRTPLTNTSVAVFDELQMLVEDSDRAAKLEGILTSLRLMDSEIRPTILGLSATLPPESTRALRSWLEVSDEMLLTTNERPIPLDTIVVDPLQWRRQPDAHMFNIPGQAPPLADQATDHDLSKLYKKRRSALAGKITRLANGEFTATLVDFLLELDPSRRILCFVPSRSAARELTGAIQSLLKLRLGATGKGSAWRVGRFVGDSKFEDAESRHNELNHSDLPNKDDVLRGLREGVAAHTAAVPSTLRRVLEEEFLSDTGLLRVIVATDTLAVGVNLPADTVIAASITGYGGGTSRGLLSAANLDNKAGRAGRRGKTKRPRGEFYIVVPTATELQDIEGLDAQQIKRLATLDGIFESYVSAPRQSSEVTSKYRELGSVSGLVLQILCQDGFARERNALASRTEKILDNLLGTYEPDLVLPSADAVIDNLLARGLLGARQSSNKIAISGLGVAVARSSLDLDAAATIERLGRLACARAGWIDLIWNACRSQEIQKTTNWVSLPPVARKHYPSLKDSILSLARAYCLDSELLRRRSVRRATRDGEGPEEKFVTEGSLVVSSELAELLESDGESASDADTNALLRTLIAYEWARGLPFKDIKRRFTGAIGSEEYERGRPPVTLRIFYADVQQLCEQIAGLIGASADISYAHDGFDFSPRMRNLAAQVEFGLPAWLAPIARMRISALHRERLAFLWDAEPPEEGLQTLLSKPQLKNHRGISQEALDEASRMISLKEEEYKVLRNKVAQRWSTVFVPNGEGELFEEVGDRLDAARSAVDYLEILNEMVANLEEDCPSSPSSDDLFVKSIWSVGGLDVSILMPHRTLSLECVQAVRLMPCLVVLWKGVDPSALKAFNEPTKARFVQPEHLLSYLANLADARGEALTAGDIVDGLSRISVSSLESDSWFLYGPDGVEAPPPFVGSSLPELDRKLPAPSADEDLHD